MLHRNPERAKISKILAGLTYDKRWQKLGFSCNENQEYDFAHLDNLGRKDLKF